MNFNDLKKAPLQKEEELNTKDNLIVSNNNTAENDTTFGIAKEPNKPIKKDNSKLPKITKDMLPSQISNWVADVCERIESPLEVGVVNALSLLGNLIGNRVAIKPKKNDYNYLEYPNIWGMVIGSPSMKKTPVFAEISKSVNRIQATESKQYSEVMNQYNEDMNIYNIRKKEFDKEIKNSKDGDVIKFTMELPTRPKRVLHFTQDATIEAIAKVIDENPKGLLILRDELSGFLKNLDSKGKEEYRSFYLEGWSSGSKSIERAGGSPLYFPKLTLGVLGNIQPSLIKQYVYEAVKGHKADGLLQRFQLLVFAESIEVKGIDRTPNKMARDSFDEIIKYILELEEFEGVDEDEYNKQAYYSYSNEAQQEYNKWYVANDKEARESGNEALESHLSKFPKLINSLALIFHICELSKGYDRQGQYDISLENFNKALQLTNVLKAHAIRLYSIYEVEEQKKEDLYFKIESKIIELNNSSQLPLSFGEVAQKIANANAKDVEEVAKDIAITEGRKILKIK